MIKQQHLQLALDKGVGSGWRKQGGLKIGVFFGLRRVGVWLILTTAEAGQWVYRPPLD